MSELRWILLGAGLIVIAAIWYRSRRKQEPGTRQEASSGLPELTETADADVDLSELEEIGRVLAEEIRNERGAPADDDSPRKLITLHVTAGTPVPGHAATAALEAAGFEFGHMDIYHYHDGEHVLFSAANMVEPGTFSDADTPGVSLFAVLSGTGGRQTLDRMLDAASQLATELDGEVLDERRSALTQQTVQHLQEQIALYETRLRAGTGGTG